MGRCRPRHSASVHPCFLCDFLFAEDKIGPNNKNELTEMFVFISKAQPLASGMFLCHFQILCGVPAEPMDRAGTQPGQGSRDTIFKMPMFLQQLAKFMVIFSCDTCLWNLLWGFAYTPDGAEFKPRGPPAQAPKLPGRGSPLAYGAQPCP